MRILDDPVPAAPKRGSTALPCPRCGESAPTPDARCRMKHLRHLDNCTYDVRNASMIELACDSRCISTQKSLDSQDRLQACGAETAYYICHCSSHLQSTVPTLCGMAARMRQSGTISTSASSHRSVSPICQRSLTSTTRPHTMQPLRLQGGDICESLSLANNPFCPVLDCVKAKV